MPRAPEPSRRRLRGRAEIEAALGEGAPIRFLAVPEGEIDSALEALCIRAAEAGAEILRVAERRGKRLGGELPVALLGPPRDADLDTVMSRGGAAWLLVGASYAGNIGTAIRTAEGSGADGVFIDNAFDHDQRREARRASMRADRYLPVSWEAAGRVIGAARRVGKKIFAVEESGDRAPWQVDLRGPALFVVGGEADGVPEALLGRCDEVLRIPMPGFISSYNLQAAVAIVAAERLRQRGETA